MKNTVFLSLLLAFFITAAPIPATAARLPQATPESVGMDSAKLAEIDTLVQEGIEAKKFPGCVVAISRNGKLVFLKAYGHRQLLPQPEPVTTDTLFDLASVTKPVACATSVMKLIEEGKIGLHDPVTRFFPEFGQNGKESITVYHLLTHQAGFIPDNALADYLDGPEKAWERICKIGLKAPTGTQYIYSDLSFITLGKIVEKVSGKTLDQYTHEHLFQPLGMNETGYLPSEKLAQRAAVTEKREGRWMQGEVHDPRAFELGGVAGHAGLFSTAEDLAVFAQMILDGGKYGDTRILNQRTVADMMRPRQVGDGGWWALGWDVRPSSYKINDRAIRHRGFTGTYFNIDPINRMSVIFLANRVHPDGKGNIIDTSGKIGLIARDAVQTIAQDNQTTDTPTAKTSQKTLTGIDVLRRDQFQSLGGRRVGLITNHTGADSSGQSTVRLFHNAKNVELVALFSPEHGIAGKLDESGIKDDKDPETGLTVYSLYGKTRQPTDESLDGIDTLVFDIQDIGCRFYTYISTMGLAMEKAAERGIRFVVLDRPNPIGGVQIEGPLFDEGQASFTASEQMPIRHGMTVGELAEYFKVKRNLPNLDLQVVRCENWNRAEYFDQTGLPWINPSPNMRNLDEAILYPGIGLLEFTNLSVGRGTATPFEWIGAPWLDGKQLAEKLSSQNLPGVRFEAVQFTPDASKFANEACGGVRFTITDRDAFDSVRTGFAVARAIHELHPDDWKSKNYYTLLKNRAVMDAVLAGQSFEAIEAIYTDDFKQFLRDRAAFLIYD